MSDPSGRDVQREAAGVAQPLRVREICLAPPQRLLRQLALGDVLFQLRFALAQIAEHRQACQGVFQPSAYLLEKALLLRVPIPRVRALVQPEQVRFVHLRVQGRRQDGLDAEGGRELCRHRTFRPGTESHGLVGSSCGLEHAGGFRVDGQIGPEREGAGELRPGTLHRHAPRRRFRIARIDQPRPIAIEDGKHRVEHVAHHLLEVVRALNGAVDAIDALQEPQMRAAFLLCLLLLIADASSLLQPNRPLVRCDSQEQCLDLGGKIGALRGGDHDRDRVLGGQPH